MTTEELKAHRRAICEALTEGKQCQVMVNGEWEEWSACTVAFRLFEDNPTYHIRIKPEPRKVWVGWPKNPDAGYGLYWMRPGDLSRADVEENQSYNWQLVEEPQ